MNKEPLREILENYFKKNIPLKCSIKIKSSSNKDESKGAADFSLSLSCDDRSIQFIGIEHTSIKAHKYKRDKGDHLMNPNENKFLEKPDIHITLKNLKKDIECAVEEKSKKRYSNGVPYLVLVLDFSIKILSKKNFSDKEWIFFLKTYITPNNKNLMKKYRDIFIFMKFNETTTFFPLKGKVPELEIFDNNKYDEMLLEFKGIEYIYKKRRIEIKEEHLCMR